MIYRKYGRVTIEIMGGEPFIYPAFADLMGKLSKMHRISITTNLSCDMNSLKNFIEQIDTKNITMCLTFHPLFATLDNFLQKAYFLKERNIPLSIHYVAYPKQLKQMRSIASQIKEKGFYFVPVPFRGNCDKAIYPERYNEEERNIIYDCMDSLKGKHVRWIENQVVQKRTKGKLCYAGQMYAFFQDDGKVYRCGADMKRSIGSIFDKGFELLNQPLPCACETCPCESTWWLVENRLK